MEVQPTPLSPEDEVSIRQSGSPGSDVPVEICARTYLDGWRNRIEGIRIYAKQNHRKLVIAGSITAGTAVLLVASGYMVKHILDRNPKADITDIPADELDLTS